MSNDTYAVTTEFDVEAVMRDGVVLRANVYRPRGEGPFPVLLTRTPYSKDGLADPPFNGFDPVVMARYGFLTVVQDVRGRFCSDGVWDPFQHGREDGYDSVEWAAGLPGSNGRVGMFGGSYLGHTQWASAVAAAPSLKAIAPLFTWARMGDGVIARGGALELGLQAYWALLQGFDYITRESSPEELEKRFAALADEHDHLADRGYWELPAADLPAAARVGVPSEFLHEETVADASYSSEDYDRTASDLASYSTGGWYDLLLQGTIDNYLAMKERGRDARLVIGPWTHNSLADPVGDRIFGVRSWRETFMVDYSEAWLSRHLAWFGRHLRADETVPLPDKPVRIFVMGRNEWRDEDSWPLERAVDQRWYLRAGGSLDPQGPDSGAQSSEFDYDPADPVPATGGNGTFVQGHRQGPIDQSGVEARADVLVFTSEPLREDLEVTGRVRAVIHVESSAPSTDWVVRLCDVDADGSSINVCDGIVRVPEGAQNRGEVEVDLWSTSNVFLAGHRVRVQVTSSSFPRWDRNLNTGDQRGPRMAVARQRVHHGGGDRASWVVLPVVEQ